MVQGSFPPYCNNIFCVESHVYQLSVRIFLVKLHVYNFLIVSVSTLLIEYYWDIFSLFLLSVRQVDVAFKDLIIQVGSISPLYHLSTTQISNVVKFMDIRVTGS